MLLSEMQRHVLEDPPLVDRRAQYFREKIYPVLFAPSSGDVPALEEAYAMLDKNSQDLDRWYMAVQRINPGWFVDVLHRPEEEVTFRDESKLVIHDGNVPTYMMRIRDLEEIEADSADLNTHVFRSVFYPKLAAAATGDVPDVESARLMPTIELNKWYEAVGRVNPQWFKPLEDLKAQADAAETLKKKRRKRTR